MLITDQIYLCSLCFSISFLLQFIVLSYYALWGLIALALKVLLAIILIIVCYVYWGVDVLWTVFLGFLFGKYPADWIVYLVKKKVKNRTFLNKFIASDFLPIGPDIKKTIDKTLSIKGNNIRIKYSDKLVYRDNLFYGAINEKVRDIDIKHGTFDRHQSVFGYRWYYIGSSNQPSFGNDHIDCELELIIFDKDRFSKQSSDLQVLTSRYLFDKYYIPHVPEEDVLGTENFENPDEQDIQILVNDINNGFILLSINATEYSDQYCLFRQLNEDTLLLLTLKWNVYMDVTEKTHFDYCHELLSSFSINGKTLYAINLKNILLGKTKTKSIRKPQLFDETYPNRSVLSGLYRQHAEDPLAWKVFEESANFEGWLHCQYSQYRNIFVEKCNNYVEGQLNNFNGFIGQNRD